MSLNIHEDRFSDALQVEIIYNMLCSLLIYSEIFPNVFSVDRVCKEELTESYAKNNQTSSQGAVGLC